MGNSAIRHLSVRIPWHDTGWDGRVCAAPSANVACLALKRIHEERDDSYEDSVPGTDWEELPTAKLPPCVRETAGFMRGREFSLTLTHPYASLGTTAHENLKPLTMRFPEYSAPCVPFRWMRRAEAESIADSEGAGYSIELEEEADELIPFESGWVQHGANQRHMLETFFSHVDDASLAFFYAKRVPHTEEDGRVLIGVGRVLGVTMPDKYPGENPLDTIAWECMAQHSIRPGFADGFLLPYHEALEAAATDQTLDPAEVVAFAPEDAWLDFSYGCEHVSHDAAINSLLACQHALEAAERLLPKRRGGELQWLSDRLGELWKLRGPCPGLGAALEAFGVERGTMVVRQLAPLLGENEDPWPLIDRAMEDPRAVRPGLEKSFGINLRRKWKALPHERRALLQAHLAVRAEPRAGEALVPA